jgi:hypothetical protein
LCCLCTKPWTTSTELTIESNVCCNSSKITSDNGSILTCNHKNHELPLKYDYFILINYKIYKSVKNKIIGTNILFIALRPKCTGNHIFEVVLVFGMPMLTNFISSHRVIIKFRRVPFGLALGNIMFFCRVTF